MPLDNTRVEELSIEIARVFDIEDLERIALKATGQGLFETWVGRGNSVEATAFDLLEEVGKDDRYAPKVLAEMMLRRPQAADLIRLIDLACPEARQVYPVSALVGGLVSGLDAVKARLADRAVRDRLTLSVAKLRLVVEKIDSLHAYKSLHECLHQLQAKQFRELKEAARNLPTAPDEAAVLLAYRNQLRGACLVARQAVDELPEDPGLRATELLWIEKLEAAGDQFHDAIDNGDAAGARKALLVIRSVMGHDPIRLNQLIFVTAKVLPLDDLIAALGDLGGTDVPSIADAVAALQGIGAAIRAQVAEHGEWQAADLLVSQIDLLFENEGPDLLSDFAFAWLDLKLTAQRLAERTPGAPWAVKMLKYIRNVDDGLVPEDPGGPYRHAFESFRSEAQFRFLSVDMKLKSDCAALVRIGNPLRGILEELGS